MTAAEYKSILARLGLTQINAARFVNAGDRTGQRWAAEGPPGSVAKLFKLMLALRLTPEAVDKRLKGK